MFTLQQIADTHARVRSGANFPAYVRDMGALGVDAYELYVSDGHARYFGADGFTISSDARPEALKIAGLGSSADLQAALRIHQQGGTDYDTFCRDAAAAGVEKWTVNMRELRCSYSDQAGNILLTEEIPAVR